MMITVQRILSVALLSVVAVLPAQAHDFSIIPGEARVEAGASFVVSMQVGERFPGEAVAWRVGRIVEFHLTDSKGRQDVTDPPLQGDPPAARLMLRAPGTALIGLCTDPSYIELPAEKFDAYLEEEGHTAALRARRKVAGQERPGRERYTRHVKTIVNATGPQSSVALTRLGLALEIVPEKDLAAIRPGDRIPVRLFYQGDPYIQGRVCTTWDGRGPEGGLFAWCGETDGAGRAQVPIEKPGWQIIRTTRMIPVRDDEKADWHSYWASLTFKVEEAGP